MDNAPFTPRYTLTGEMLNLVSQIKHKLTSFVPPATITPTLRRTNKIRTVPFPFIIKTPGQPVQITAEIDGNLLCGPENEIRELSNACAAYRLIKDIDPYDFNDALTVHGIMLKNLSGEYGRLRTSNVSVFKNRVPIYDAPPPGKLPALIEALYDWLGHSSLPEPIKSSIFHYGFETIHPFDDGNGRMGRFLQSAMLTKWNPVFAKMPLEAVIKKNQKAYYKALLKNTLNIDSSTDAFVLYMLRTISDEMSQGY
jgi:hypothetical protein